MKQILIMLVVLFITTVPSFARDKDEDMYNYELESAVGNFSLQAGWNVAKVWNYGKREFLTKQNAMRNAVHGIILKGYPGYGGNTGVKALCPEGYEQHREFFDEFFGSGKYRQFVQLSNNGLLTADDVIKYDKKRYKVGMIVMVNTAALRAYLEQNNISKGLDFLFRDN